MQDTAIPPEPLTPRTRRRCRALAVGAERTKKQRHIAAPFNLRNDFDFNGLRSPENRAFLDATFPGNEGFSQDGLFLYVWLSPPPEPQPASFAGVPVIFVPPVPGPAGLLPPFVLPRAKLVPRRQGSIAEHLDNRYERNGSDWRPLFEAIRLHFESLDVPITEVIYFGHSVYVVLEREDTALDKLPSCAGFISCMYMFEKDMQRPSAPQARWRAEDPRAGRVVDDTTYDVLRPGVRISSDYLPGSHLFRSSTLGTRVQDADGQDYITVAAHTFSNVHGADVFHALRENGRRVGRLAGRVANTDVALMQLYPHEAFVNETFVADSNAEDDDDESLQLCGLRPPKRYDPAWLDSPDTGRLDGQIMGTSFRKIPSDGDIDEQLWEAVEWMYPEPGAELPFPDSSMCGTVVCGNDNKVLCFFQYVFKEGPWKTWSVGTSVRELTERGFR